MKAKLTRRDEKNQGSKKAEIANEAQPKNKIQH